MRKYKSIYFPDHPGETSAQRHVRLAFGEGHLHLYEKARGISSADLREMIGFANFSSLADAAKSQNRTVNALCLARLAARLNNTRSGQLLLFSDDVDPLQTTYRGGLDQPLHRWFPYLEGYSPAFVEHLLDTYLPSAARVLEPFCGIGTTPYVCALRDVVCYYSELNPVLQVITRTKLEVIAMSSHKRRLLLGRLNGLIERLDEELKACRKADDLSTSYRDCFSEAEYFSEETYDLVLRMRTLIDQVARQSPVLAHLCSIAVCANLITCSFLKRAGDVRYKTKKELERGIPDLLESVASYLRVYAEDISRAPSAQSNPVFACANAKRIGAAEIPPADGLITSPPYLNGTNYFRNTKLELWFLRHLRTKADLAAFRNDAITAGINDVTVAKKKTSNIPGVQELVTTLTQDNYDKRIPHMVESYFCDIAQVLAGAAHKMKTGAIACIDLGDSQYGGIYVDTPSLLTEVAVDLGLDFVEKRHLRGRLSKDRTQLSQVLLVFRRRGNSIKLRSRERAWEDRWNEFKRILPHQREPFARRNWGNFLHSLCSYQGKMKPSLAHHLVRTFTNPGDAILDPFCGSGTIPLEACLQGRNGFGIDIGRFPCIVTNAKLRPASVTSCESLLADLENFIKDYQPTPPEYEDAAAVSFNKSIPDYFHPDTLREILAARSFLLRSKTRSAAFDLLYASTLHLLHGNRPYALSRRSHPLTPYAPTGPTEYRCLMDRLRDKVTRTLSCDRGNAFAKGRCYLGDALHAWPEALSKINAVITSPPFFDSTRFYLMNWMRMWFTGWSRQDFDTKPQEFLEVRQKQSMEVYDPVFEIAAERLVTNGLFVMHVGVSYKKDMTSTIADIGSRHLRLVDVFVEGVDHCESHGVRDKGTVKGHGYVVFVKT